MTKRTNPGLSTQTSGAQAPGAQAWTGLAALWCAQLGDLATSSAAAFAEDEAEWLRTLYALLAAAPAPTLIRGLAIPPRQQFECLIAAGAGAAAAMALFASSSGYLLSRGATGLHAASVYLPDATSDVTAIGDSAALAIVGAIAQALVDRHASREPAPLHLN